MTEAASVFLSACLQRVLPVLWPVERRVNGLFAGLFCVEENRGSGWTLVGFSFHLEVAIAISERLHCGPLNGIGPGAASSGFLPSHYRCNTEEGWQGLLFKAAVRNNPFSPSPGALNSFRTASWTEGLSAASEAVRAGNHVVVLGESGVGKSTFLADLARSLASIAISSLLWTGSSLPEEVGGADALLLDDAGDCDQEDLTKLLNTGMPIVLASYPGSKLSLIVPALFPVIVGIGPLSPSETTAFVLDRLRRAGRPQGWVTDDALSGLAQSTGGSFRTLTLLASAAAFLADLESSPTLNLIHIQHAAMAAQPGGAPIQVRALPVGRVSRKRMNSAGGSDHSIAKIACRSTAIAGVCLALSVICLAHFAGGNFASQLRSSPFNAGSQVDGNSATLETYVYDLSPSKQAFAVVSEAPPEDSTFTPSSRSHLGLVADAAPVRNETNERVKIDRSDIPAVAIAAEQQPAVTALPDHLEQSSGADNKSREGILRERAIVKVIPIETAATNIQEYDVSQKLAVGSFAGLVNNETLRLTGKLSLEIIRGSSLGVVRAKFHAWNGLLGTGELVGTVSADGRLALSGRLLMGRNAFQCTLNGVIRGNRLTGSAKFVRPWGGDIALSNFDLLKS